MTRFVNALALVLAIGSLGAPAAAQEQSTGRETRPATTTFNGDTGLWFVPTGEVLPARKWSFSLYRVNVDYEQGFTDVSNWPLTFGVGIADRFELFGAWSVVNRIDRDVRPLFFSALGSIRIGGVVNEYPFVRDAWTGNQVGDFWLGVKGVLTSQYRQDRPVSIAARALVKLPTADHTDGAGTGKTDFAFDGIVSSEFSERVELSGFAGFIVRGDPDEYDLLNGFRWGVGAGFPTRRHVRLSAELHGEVYTDDDSVVRNPPRAELIDGLLHPVFSPQPEPIKVTVGLTWTAHSGLFVGGGLNWTASLAGRSERGPFEDEAGDSLGFQVRLGYHPGARVYVPPPPPPPPPPAPVAKNGPPSVRAQCNPCTVDVGRTSTLSADASDPDGDALTYRWNAPAGTISTPSARQTPWTAPMQDGPVPITVTVTDTRGGTASDAITLHVIKPAVKEFVFEDVHFDFDRYSLRPEATRALDEAISTLQQNPELRLEVEGHTCNIGTAEYNLALGERRGNAVRGYLTSRGIAADRLRTVSYGEERPKHDNAREETRRLNRRAAITVRVAR